MGPPPVEGVRSLTSSPQRRTVGLRRKPLAPPFRARSYRMPIAVGTREDESRALSFQ